MEAAGGVGPGGAVFGLGSAVADYYSSDQLRAPRRQAPRISEMQRENASLRAQVSRLEENQNAQQAQIERLQKFMEDLQRNQTPPSTSRPPPSDDADRTD